MSTQLPVLTQLCPICYINPPKYKCPRCAMRTCSMDCSKTHKIRASCSGVRDPAKYIAKREMKSSTVDMDFNFLKSVQSTRDAGHGELKRLEKGVSMTSRRKLNLAKRMQGLKRALERGVEVRRMPQVMERAQQNKTKWDSKSKSVQWTVEWITAIGAETKTILEHGISDSTTVREAYGQHTAEKDNLHFLRKKVGHPANKAVYLRLDPDKSLLDNLKGTTVMEFPSILVVDEIQPDWTVEAPT